MGNVGHRPHLRHGSLLPPLLQTERLTHLMRETAEARAISNAMPVAVNRQPPVPVSVIVCIVLTSVPSSRIRQSRTYRSEEHTSELQSLMRISYTVFCL